MDEEQPRRAELIAAALAGELSEDEQRELAAACAADPTMVAELEELRSTVSRLDRAQLSWQEVQPPAGLGDRILAATSGRQGQEPSAVADRGGAAAPRSRVWLLGAAAGLLLVGGVGGVALQGMFDGAPSGPPGTLGAVEDITFEGAPADSSIDAALVAHTWGTETVLEVDGLRVGESFEVVLVDRDGAELSSGTFFGTEQTVTCRMNAAVLRDEVSAVQIQDEDGRVVAASSVPAITSGGD